MAGEIGLEPISIQIQSLAFYQLNYSPKWCRPWDSNPEPRAFETPASTNWARAAKFGAPLQIRTGTEWILSPLPLPVGLEELKICYILWSPHGLLPTFEISQVHKLVTIYVICPL